jgi:hypothetical protein
MILIIVQEHQESQWADSGVEPFRRNHNGSLLTKSRIISKEALPEPTIIPALSVVVGKVPVFRMVSTFFWSQTLTKNLR